MGNSTEEKKAKRLNVFEVVRDGDVFWQTDSKLPKTMLAAMPWVLVSDGIYEIQRPLTRGLVDFGNQIESFGFSLKVKEQRQVVKQASLASETLTDGEKLVGEYVTAKEVVEDAEKARVAKREELRKWLLANGSHLSPTRADARMAQIGRHRVYNSWVNGNETPWGKRNTNGVAQWAIAEDCANTLLQVTIARTVSYDTFLAEGVPAGFESKFVVDADMYDYYTRIGAIPTKIQDEFEARGKGRYDVKLYATNEFGCPSCGSEVTKTAKFCAECGTKLEIK